MKKPKYHDISSDLSIVTKIDDARENMLGSQSRVRAAIIAIVAATLICMLMDMPRGTVTILGGLTALTLFNAYECYELRRRIDKVINLIETTSLEN
ncbi:hypothetical protein [Janthinobacterium sp. PAMC25594]|uniref:hypothetical protein n=1 Tax=Janthinobacterium sp. PAMC25594 TaxID=2861284 RepID=UPI001C636AEA|nr:hypothetical protein [Janthinobacterium sp. PAMC25594]QYG05627.1 hypothetical protein KY494_20245 [Janthinobacterium sp. PAMC25594]